LRNGLAGRGDAKILEYAEALGYVLVSTDSDFKTLLHRFPKAMIVILRACNYPTAIAAGVLRRNAIRIAELPKSRNRLLILDT
jgi:predicted nuclease of predicted toxin-antitoxin system